MATIPTNAVDWVLCELRTSPAGPVVFSKSVFLSRSGDVLDQDGAAGIRTPIADDSYYLIIRHRNHLPLMSAAPVALQMDATAVYDFTTGLQQIYQHGGVVNVGGLAIAAMAGDFNADRFVTATDFALWHNEMNANGYLDADADLDGRVDETDRDLWLQNAQQAGAGSAP